MKRKPGAYASGRNQNQRVGLPEEALVFYRVSVIPCAPESVRRENYSIILKCESRVPHSPAPFPSGKGGDAPISAFFNSGSFGYPYGCRPSSARLEDAQRVLVGGG